MATGEMMGTREIEMPFAIGRCKAIFTAACLAALLAGCANQPKPLYYWGGFTDQQYALMAGKQGPEEGITLMEETQEKAKAKGLPLPPGFSAHLGMLYGLTGRTDRFEQGLQAEVQQFPESATYVDFLLKKKQTPVQPPQQQSQQ